MDVLRTGPIKNTSSNRMLRITFTDRDVVHLLPGESYTPPRGFTVHRTDFV